MKVTGTPLCLLFLACRIDSSAMRAGKMDDQLKIVRHPPMMNLDSPSFQSVEERQADRRVDTGASHPSPPLTWRIGMTAPVIERAGAVSLRNKKPGKRAGQFGSISTAPKCVFAPAEMSILREHLDEPAVLRLLNCTNSTHTYAYLSI
jgi:hypothetical protein